MAMRVPRAYRRVIRLAAVASSLPPGFNQPQREHFERLRAIMADPNVVGVGVAEKVVGGARLQALALTFHVREKKPRRQLDGLIVPSVVAPPRGPALFTDVVEVGEVRPQALIARSPIAGGFSIALAGEAPGTLGAVVTWRGSPALLSAAHVLARSGLAPLGATILYPAGPDGGHPPADAVGTLAHHKALRRGGAYVNRFDAALASIAPSRIKDLDPALPGSSAPLSWTEPSINMRVRIVGRSSSVSRSTVRSVAQTLQLAYPGVGLVGFQEQCACDLYTKDGDSGAVVVDEDTGAIVGLHFAATSGFSYFSPIRPIMEALKFTF